MVATVCVIWSAIGIGLIAFALFAALSNAITESRDKDENIYSIKRRLNKIESALDIDDEDY